MIITSDKVGMSSTRNYSRSMSQFYKTSTLFTGNFFANVNKQALENKDSSKEQYDSYSSSIDRNQSGLTGAFTYTNQIASDFQTNTVSYPTAAISDSKSIGTGSVANTFADFKREAFYSLMDLIRNFRLRSLFETAGSSDSPSSSETGSTSNSSGSSNSADSSILVGNSNMLIMSTSPSAITWNVTTSFSSIYTETEATTFSTTGTVTTADGRNIDFNMNLEMSREYMEQNQLTYMNSYSSILTDPLVINMTDASASISDQTFLFDIDGDGKTEEHASLGSGSGFLALDKNNDGMINDGSELFGTKSGNGFADLAAYDSDGNGWIDEADDIYKDLKVWTKDENGKDTLLSLKDADVGAIYLGSSKTDFSLKDDVNTTKAQVRQTGFYLHEDGKAGSVQQVDL
ncbi:MAG: hypothetical protein PHW47_13430 [Lachnospira sp.]|nr:hypothetical protein [Lachnospira sp.]